MSFCKSTRMLVAGAAAVIGFSFASAYESCTSCSAPPAPVVVETAATLSCDPCAPAPAPAPVVTTPVCDPCAPVAAPAPVVMPVRATYVDTCNPCKPARVKYCDPCKTSGRGWRWFGWFRRSEPTYRYDNYGYNHYYRGAPSHYYYR